MLASLGAGYRAMSALFSSLLALPTVQHVLLVEHGCWHLTLVSRRDDGTWTYAPAGPGGSVHLSAIGVTLHVDEVYEGVVEVGGPSRDARRPSPG